MSQEQLYDVISRQNAHGAPLLGDCRLILGDGQVVVQFKNGRAKAPASVIDHLRTRGDVDIIGRIGAAPAEVVVEVVTEPEPDPVVEPTMPEPAAETPTPEPATEAPTTEVDDEALRLAQEHLRAEGEEVPEVEPLTLPEGFSTVTEEGEPRCLAAKADGTQCANAAVDGTRACGIAKHKEALAS